MQRLRDRLHDIGRGAIVDGVHGVDAQAVQAVLLDPVQRIVDEERAHERARRPVEGDRRSPRRAARGIEELRCAGVQVVAVGPEMVVDDVEQHHHAQRMSGRHEALELLGSPIRGIGRKGQHAVVAPVARTREVGHRHQFDRGNAEPRQCAQALAGRLEGSGGGERTDVQLVDDRLMPGPAAPVIVRPVMGARIDQFARAVYVEWIEARCRVRNQQAVVEPVAIELAGPRLAHHHFVPAVAGAAHRHRSQDLERRSEAPVVPLVRAQQFQHHPLAGRRPKAKARPFPCLQCRTERHGVRTPHDMGAQRVSNASERPCSA